MNDTLFYLAGTGAIAIVSILVSNVAEKFAFWHNMDSAVKLLIQVLLSTGIAVGATFLIKNPTLWESIEDYLVVVVNIIVAISINQGWHTKREQLH